MSQRGRFSPARIASVYLVAAGAWIIGSDWAAGGLSATQTSKGLAFVAVTAAGLFVMMRGLAGQLTRHVSCWPTRRRTTR